MKSGRRRVNHSLSRATHLPAREEQSPEEDARVTARGRLVARVLASGG